MEDSYTLKEYPEDLRGILDIALHHACWSHPSRPCSMNQLDLTTRSVACLSPSLSTFIHFTQTPAFHLWYPAHPHRLQEVMTCRDKGREHECLKLFIQSNWTAQNRAFSHPMPHCGALSRHTPGRPARAALSNVANAWRSLDRLLNEPLDSRRDTPEPMHGLALTNFLDCNTRHVECSTCCVPSVGTHNPTNTTTASTMKHAEVLNGNYDTDTNQGKYLFIYLNSLVLNLCLYTVNSATLQRITLKQRWETLRDVKLNNLCCLYCT